MKKTGLLNSEISAVVAKMGHFDLLCISDAGLPIDDHKTKRIDLALTPGIPSFLETLDALMKELSVQKIYIAKEMKEKNSQLYEGVKRRFPETPVEEIFHEQFKTLANTSRAVIRSGECTPYANIILESGVAF